MHKSKGLMSRLAVALCRAPKLRALGKSVDHRTCPVSSRATLARDSRQVHSARAYSWHYPVTTFSGNVALFFWNIFLPNISKKKDSVSQKCHLYFWIMVLPNDDVFGELCAFFSKYFSLKYRNCALESFNFYSNQMRAKTCFLLNYRQQPYHIRSCTKLRNAAQISISTNCAVHWQPQQTTLRSAAWLVETRLYIHFFLGVNWVSAVLSIIQYSSISFSKQ